ncbi:MAG: PIG-L family deacetylase [Planctomycetota bacterium]
MSTTDSHTVLAIGAHPGTLELLCGGTLILLHQRGWRIVMATMTPGNPALDARPAKKFAQAQISAANQSAQLVAGEYQCLESVDFMIFFNDAPCRRVTGLVRATAPDIVLTHSAVDGVADNEETSRIVHQACTHAPDADYESEGWAPGLAPLPRVPALYYLDPADGRDFLGRPIRTALVVDVSGVVETKDKMLAKYGEAYHGTFRTRMRELGSQRGREAGCSFGEGLRRHTGEAFPRHDQFGDTLDSLLHAIS